MNFPPRVAEVLGRLERTRWKRFNLHPDSARLLALLARLERAKSVIEVGTSNGYSAIVLGNAIQAHGGHVITIERDGDMVEEATANIADAGLDEVVTIRPGSAYRVLETLQGPWDFAFLDATKQEYEGYLERLLPKLAPRALVAADNLLSHAAELEDFQETVAADDRFSSVVLPVGAGLLVALFERDVARAATS